MAGDIGVQRCQNVAEGAEFHDGQGENEAATAMVEKRGRDAGTFGWEPLNYHMYVERTARDGLKQRRNPVSLLALSAMQSPFLKAGE